MDSRQPKTNLEHSNRHGSAPRGGEFTRMMATSRFPELSTSQRIQKLDRLFEKLTGEAEKLVNTLDGKSKAEFESSYQSLKKKAKASRDTAFTGLSSPRRRDFGYIPPNVTSDKKEGMSNYSQNVSELEQLLHDRKAKSEGQQPKGDNQPGTIQADTLDQESNKFRQLLIEAPKLHRSELVQKLNERYSALTEKIDQLISFANSQETEQYQGLKQAIEQSQNSAFAKSDSIIRKVMPSYGRAEQNASLSAYITNMHEMLQLWDRLQNRSGSGQIEHERAEAESSHHVAARQEQTHEFDSADHSQEIHYTEEQRQRVVELLNQQYLQKLPDHIRALSDSQRHEEFQEQLEKQEKLLEGFNNAKKAWEDFAHEGIKNSQQKLDLSLYEGMEEHAKALTISEHIQALRDMDKNSDASKKYSDALKDAMTNTFHYDGFTDDCPDEDSSFCQEHNRSAIKMVVASYLKKELASRDMN